MRLFVYGTLRHGHGNYGLIQPAVREVILDCKAEGRIYFVSQFGGYPVAKLDEEGTIIGDILVVDNESPCVDWTFDMEIGAGYVPQEIPVDTPFGKMDCLAFHYVRTPMGALIPDGDWSAAHYGRVDDEVG